MSNNILTVENFCLSFKNKSVLENITFNVEIGDYLAIGGIPGSGKSSLIKSILGIINTGISGDITFHNIKKAEVSYIPQNIMQKKEEFLGSAREVVAVSLLARKKGRPFTEEDWDKVDSLLKKLNLYDVKDKKITKLTNGQQLKINLAKHLINEPKLLFIDSPNSTLDMKSKLDYCNTLKKLCEDDNLTILFITNNIKELCKYANKLLFLKKKEKVYYFGDAKEFIKDKE